jgi:hypothetical protein
MGDVRSFEALAVKRGGDMQQRKDKAEAELAQKVREQQHTGNHDKKEGQDKGGADKFGGTRKGAENVE